MNLDYDTAKNTTVRFEETPPNFSTHKNYLKKSHQRHTDTIIWKKNGEGDSLIQEGWSEWIKKGKPILSQIMAIDEYS